MVDIGYTVLTCYFISPSLGKNVVQNYREQLQNAKRLAESIAVITPALEKEFLEVCLYCDLNMKHQTRVIFSLLFVLLFPLFFILSISVFCHFLLLHIKFKCTIKLYSLCLPLDAKYY